MTQGLNPLTGSYITPEGVFSQEQLLVAQIINDLDDTLHLVREENGPRCAVLCNPHIGAQYVVLTCDLSEVDHTLVGRIIQADYARHGKGSLADQLEAQEAAKRLLDQLKYEEQLAEAAEFAKTVLKSPLHTFKHKGKVYR